MASILHAIHASDMVWRDCKPANFMVTGEGRLRPLDFEGACPNDRPDPAPWSTPAFAPPNHLAAHETRSSVFDDLYSLGAVIYYLLTGRLPESPSPVPVAKLRRGVPVQAREIVETLLTASPRNRPDALTVARKLRTAPLTG
jgi:serine/threonine protein kinase